MKQIGVVLVVLFVFVSFSRAESTCSGLQEETERLICFSKEKEEKNQIAQLKEKARLAFIDGFSAWNSAYQDLGPLTSEDANELFFLLKSKENISNDAAFVIDVYLDEVKNKTNFNFRSRGRFGKRSFVPYLVVNKNILCSVQLNHVYKVADDDVAALLALFVRLIDARKNYEPGEIESTATHLSCEKIDE